MSSNAPTNNPNTINFVGNEPNTFTLSIPPPTTYSFAQDPANNALDRQPISMNLTSFLSGRERGFRRQEAEDAYRWKNPDIVTTIDDKGVIENYIIPKSKEQIRRERAEERLQYQRQEEERLREVRRNGEIEYTTSKRRRGG